MSTKAKLEAELTLKDSVYVRKMLGGIALAKRLRSEMGALSKTAGFAAFGAGAIAAAAAGAVMVASIKKGIEVGGKFNDLANRIGDKAGKTAVLATAFEFAGLEAEDLGASVNRMQKSIANGSKAFADLGLNIDDLRKLSPTEQFTEIGNAIAKIQDPADRTLKAMELFGKAGGKLNQIFGDNGGLELARKSLGSMAPLLDKNASSIDDIGDRVDALGKKWDSFSVGIVSGLAPVLNPLLDKMIAVDTAKFGAGLAADIGDAFKGQGTTDAIADLSGRFVKMMSSGALAVADAIAAALTKGFEGPIADLQSKIQSISYLLAHPTEYVSTDEISKVKARAATLDEKIPGLEKQFRSLPKGAVNALRDQESKLGGFGEVTPEMARTREVRDSLTAARKERAQLEDRMRSFANIDPETIKKRLLSEGVRVGFENGGLGLTSGERMQQAVGIVKGSGARNFPRSAAGLDGRPMAAPAPVSVETSEAWNSRIIGLQNRIAEGRRHTFASRLTGSVADRNPSIYRSVNLAASRAKAAGEKDTNKNIQTTAAGMNKLVESVAIISGQKGSS